MKFSNIIKLAIVLFTTCSCTGGGINEITTEPLVGKKTESFLFKDLFPKLFIDSLAVGTGHSWAGLVGVMGDSTCETIFHTGRGHNEFSRISFAKGADKSLLLLNNPLEGDKLLSLTVIGNTENIEKMKDQSAWKKYDLSRLPAYRNCSDYFVHLTDSTILVPGAPYDDLHHIFSIIDYKKQTVTPLEYWPEKGEESPGGAVHPCFGKHAFYTENCKLYGNNKGHFFYQLQGFDRFAFVFSIEGGKVNIIKELYSDISEYKIDKTTSRYKVVKYGQGMSTFANSHNIYILLRDNDVYGNPLDEDAESPVYGNIVEVYDWNGNKQRTIKIDKFIQHFIVSDDNKILYAYRGKKIWMYNLME